MEKPSREWLLKMADAEDTLPNGVVTIGRTQRGTMTLERAVTIAAIAHSGQKRRNGEEYVVHVLSVMLDVKPENRISAVLHDVIEDTTWTMEDLIDAGLSEEDEKAIRLLTHEKDVPYESYIINLSENRRARDVKLADIHHNYNSDPKPEKKIKYEKARRFLLDLNLKDICGAKELPEKYP